MAAKATIIKVRLHIADMDRHYYQDHSLTVAQHPSENAARVMVRLLAFALNASDTLTFGQGLSSESDDPELYERSLADEIELWVEFGQSDEKWLRKACGRAKKVQLFAYGGRSVPIWWEQNQRAFERYRNLQVWEISEEAVSAMAELLTRTMSLQCNISEGQVWLAQGEEAVTVEPVLLKDYSNH